MTVPEMMALMDGTLAAAAPLYDQLHCLAKHTPGRALQAAGAAPHPGALDRQPLGAVVARPGRRAPTSIPFFKSKTPRVHRAHRRGLLRLAGLSAPARELLAEVRPLSRADAALAAQEEQPRLGLAHRRRGRRALAHERRAQPAVVRHRPPRARPHLLLPGLRPPRGALPAARGRQPRLPRGGRRARPAGQRADPVPAQAGHRAAGARARRPRAGCCSRRSIRSSSCPSRPAP